MVRNCWRISVKLINAMGKNAFMTLLGGGPPPMMLFEQMSALFELARTNAETRVENPTTTENANNTNTKTTKNVKLEKTNERKTDAVHVDVLKKPIEIEFDKKNGQINIAKLEKLEETRVQSPKTTENANNTITKPTKNVKPEKTNDRKTDDVHVDVLKKPIEIEFDNTRNDYITFNYKTKNDLAPINDPTVEEVIRASTKTNEYKTETEIENENEILLKVSKSLENKKKLHPKTAIKEKTSIIKKLKTSEKTDVACGVIVICLLAIAIKTLKTKVDDDDKEVKKFCTLSIPNDIPYTSPVFFYNPYTFQGNKYFKPTQSLTKVPPTGQLTLSCINSKIATTLTTSVELICSDKGEWEHNGVTKTISTMNCLTDPTPKILPTLHFCANGAGLMHQVGYENHITVFARVYDICFDIKSTTTYYTKHEINGAVIEYAPKARGSYFLSQGTGHSNAYYEKHYGTNNEIARFKALFGENQQYVKSMQSSLVRGHLTPNADFIFPYERHATFFYMNVQPEFNSINNGNWKRVENLARDVAKAYRTTLTVYTGTYGTLSLTNLETGKSQEVYLDSEEKIKTPLYYFKVLYNENMNSAIVLLTLNNPYATAIPKLCTDVCAQAGFNVAGFSDFTRGYTFCCDYNEFQSFYKELPRQFGVSLLIKPY